MVTRNELPEIARPAQFRADNRFRKRPENALALPGLIGAIIISTAGSASLLQNGRQNKSTKNTWFSVCIYTTWHTTSLAMLTEPVGIALYLANNLHLV
jgi:hypothetical protein